MSPIHHVMLCALCSMESMEVIPLIHSRRGGQHWHSIAPSTLWYWASAGMQKRQWRYNCHWFSTPPFPFQPHPRHRSSGKSDSYCYFMLIKVLIFFCIISQYGISRRLREKDWLNKRFCLGPVCANLGFSFFTPQLVCVSQNPQKHCQHSKPSTGSYSSCLNCPNMKQTSFLNKGCSLLSVNLTKLYFTCFTYDWYSWKGSKY